MWRLTINCGTYSNTHHKAHDDSVTATDEVWLNIPHLQRPVTTAAECAATYCHQNDHKSAFVFSFSLYFCSVPCIRLSWPSRQILKARKYTIQYRTCIHILTATISKKRLDADWSLQNVYSAENIKISKTASRNTLNIWIKLETTISRINLLYCTCGNYAQSTANCWGFYFTKWLVQKFLVQPSQRVGVQHYVILLKLFTIYSDNTVII